MLRTNLAETNVIVQELQERITKGIWGPGQPLPSERSLAGEFQVGRAQIQGAIDALIAKGLIEQEPNCRPRVRQHRPHTRRRAAIGKDQIAIWIHPNLEDLGAATILQGIRNSLGAAGYVGVIGCPESPQSRSEAGFLRALMKSPNVAGAIIWPGSEGTREDYERLLATGIPMVFVDRHPPEPIQADLVATDNRRAAKAAVRHLIELGHRRIAMVSNTEDASTVRDRVAGYREAMREAGLPLPPMPLDCLPLGIGKDACERASEIVARMIARPEHPTAIFAVNDQAAMHLYDAIHAAGLNVPRDFSLIGFDWFMRWVPSGGHLTTVCQHFEEIGRLAVDLLLERIDSPHDRLARNILVEAPLIIKSSTSVPLSV